MYIYNSVPQSKKEENPPASPENKSMPTLERIERKKEKELCKGEEELEG